MLSHPQVTCEPNGSSSWNIVQKTLLDTTTYNTMELSFHISQSAVIHSYHKSIRQL